MSKVATLQLGPTDQRRLAPLYAEIAAGLGNLYGSAAASDYLARAERIWAVNLAHPAVTVLGQVVDASLAGVVVAVRRDTCADIAFLFVAASWQDGGHESTLVRAMVTRLREMGISRIVSECVPLSPFDLDRVYEAMGFLTINREIMSAPLTTPRLQAQRELKSVHLSQRTWSGAAECLVSAYREAPGRILHLEMTEQRRAEAFIERVHAGAYGTFHPGYARGCFRGGTCIGVVLGAEVAPGVGFILQVAVEPGARGQGIGRSLIADLAGQFLDRGLDTLALGVTSSNPARNLYERMGFQPLRQVAAYLWSNPLCPQLDTETQ